MTISLSSLISAATASQILSTGLQVAQALGLSVTTWRDDDPTRVTFHFLSEFLATKEGLAVEFVRSGFLSLARGQWLTLIAEDYYGVTRTEATFATSTVSLQNTGGGFYILDPGDITVENSTTGATYHNTTSITIGAGGSGTVDVVADEAGSSGSAAADEIDTLVTTYTGVTVTASTAAVGTDEQSDSSLRTQCLATLGALSPNGPADAYEYVCRDSELTGTTEITRAKSSGETTDGTVTVYVAGASGAVSGGAVTAAQDAVEQWATPLCITPTVASAVAVPIAITATVSGGSVPEDVEDQVESAVTAMLADIDIDGLVAVSAIYTVIHGVLVDNGVTSPTVTLTAPAADTDLDADEVPTIGAVSVTEV